MSFLNKKQIFLALAIILLLGVFLRVYRLSQIPLYGDELTLVYDSYSLLKTGHDQTGQFLPLTFSMGAGRPAGYVYGSIPFVALFGPTEWGVRGLSLLSGLGIILTIFLISQKIFSTKVGLMTGLITALSPWDINLSRGGFEAHLALLLALLGIWAFLNTPKKNVLYIFSAITFGLTLHTYPTYKLVLPFFLPLLFYYSKTTTHLRSLKSQVYLVAGAVTLLFFVILAVYQTFTGGSENRFFSINIFSDQKLNQQIVQQINYDRTISEAPLVLRSLLHNKTLEYGYILGNSYFNNLSLDFLFLHGDSNPRHNMSTMGELYMVEIILIFLGLGYLWQKRDQANLIWLIGWILIAPLPTTLLGETHALRNAFMLPPLILLSSLGLVYLLSIKDRKISYPLLGVIILGFLFQLMIFAVRLYFLAPWQLSHFWSYSAKQAALLTKQEKAQYDYVILSDKIDNIEFAYPVYSQIDPQLTIGQNIQKTQLKTLQFKKFDNVYIGYVPSSKIGSFVKSLNSRVLFVTTPEDKKYLNNPQVLEGLDDLDSLAVNRLPF